MGLKFASVYNRLKILLAYHDKLRAENREKKQLDRTAARIRHLTHLLEKYNEVKITPAGLDD